MQLSIDEAEAFLDETAETFPAALFDELNGGVNLLEDTVPDPDFPPGEMYILGEYCNDMMGRYINLYFGSFSALAQLEDWDRETWEAELRTTLSHELRTIWSSAADSMPWMTGMRKSWLPGGRNMKIEIQPDNTCHAL